MRKQSSVNGVVHHCKVTVGKEVSHSACYRALPELVSKGPLMRGVSVHVTWGVKSFCLVSAKTIFLSDATAGGDGE